MPAPGTPVQVPGPGAAGRAYGNAGQDFFVVGFASLIGDFDRLHERYV
jgi:hypothetical protein